MNEQKTIDDVIFGLQKLINPVMMLSAHYDVLQMFVENCNYDGTHMEQILDTLEEYYELYQQSPETQQKQIIDELIKMNINPIFLSEFFITYEQDLEVMKQQEIPENKEYMATLTEEVTNPTELIKDVKAYVQQL